MSIFFPFFSSGVYAAAAHDFKTEWVVVKGIKDFVDETQSSSRKWQQIACVMAASVVANILNDSVIFQDWPYFNAGIASYINLSFLYTGTDLILICLHVFLLISHTNQDDFT